MRKYLKMAPRLALQLLTVLGLVAGFVWLGATLFGGGGGGGGGKAAAALAISGNQDAWVPGQAPLTADPLYLQIMGSAAAHGDQRLAARLRLLRQIELRKKRAAEAASRRAKEEAERRRRAQLAALARLRAAREAALRRAKARYQQQLREAAEAKRKAAAEKRRLERERRERLRALERKRRIKPGEECNFESVQEQYDCEEGRQ